MFGTLTPPGRPSRCRESNTRARALTVTIFRHMTRTHHRCEGRQIQLVSVVLTDEPQLEGISVFMGTAMLSDWLTTSRH